MIYLGDFAEDAVVYFPFTTNAADGGRESLSASLEEADIVIFKNNSAMTLDASTITITANPGSMVGVYTVSVNMANDADFTTGAEYSAVLYASDETVDSQNIAAVLATWSCQRASGTVATYARVGAPAGASVSADIAAVKSDSAAILIDTAEIGAAGAGLTEAGGTGDHLTAVPWNAAWDAEVQSECTDALNAYDPPTNTEMTAAFTEIKGATWDSGTDTLEAIRDRGDAAWTTGAGGSPPQLLQSTTIATLATQTSFTLTAGSADDDAYNGAIVVVTDQSTSTQKAVGLVSDYTGASKTVTLDADPGIFTMAAGDTIEIIAALGAAGGGGLTQADVRTALGMASANMDTQLSALQADLDVLTGLDGVVLAASQPNYAPFLASSAPANFSSLVIDVSGRVDVSLIEGLDATNQINAACDTALTDYDGPTNTEMVAAFTEIKGSTWSAATDTLEHIRNKQTDIETDTQDLQTQIGSAGAGLSSIPWNAAWDAEVQSEANDALVALGLDHLVAVAVTGTDVIDNSIIAKLVSSSATADWDTFVNTTDSLQATRDHIGDGTNLTEAGGTGDHLTAVPFNAAWEAEIQGDVTAALNTYDPPTRTELTSDKAEILTVLGTPAGASVSVDVAAIKATADAIETDTQDIQSRLPAALVGGRIDASMGALDGNATAADNLAASALGIVVGQAVTGTLSDTQMTTNLTETTDDHYIGRSITWTSGVLAGQSSNVTDYDGTSKLLTYSALAASEAPSNGDSFVLL